MRLSEEIRSLFLSEEGQVSFGQVLGRVQEKSFGLLLILFALPSALPVPAPGYSIPGGMLLIVLASQMLAQRPAPWLPKRILDWKIKVKDGSKVVEAMVRFIAFFEKFVKPRLTVLSRAKPYEALLGIVVLFCGVSMCIPIPLTNTVPAMGVFFIGLGMLEEDGLISLGGIPVALGGLAITLSILYLIAYVGMNPVEAADYVREFIKGILNLFTGGEPGADARLMPAAHVLPRG